MKDNYSIVMTKQGDRMLIRGGVMIDFSIFATAEAWISLITLIFLEIILGVDNIVFISITTARLAPEKQHIGRKLGLAGAMIMRILFLSLASYLVHTFPSCYSKCHDTHGYHHSVESGGHLRRRHTA